MTHLCNISRIDLVEKHQRAEYKLKLIKLVIVNLELFDHLARHVTSLPGVVSTEVANFTTKSGQRPKD